jgi:hypothetical protein
MKREPTYVELGASVDETGKRASLAGAAKETDVNNKAQNLTSLCPEGGTR